MKNAVQKKAVKQLDVWACVCMHGPKLTCHVPNAGKYSLWRVNHGGPTSGMQKKMEHTF